MEKNCAAEGNWPIIIGNEVANLEIGKAEMGSPVAGFGFGLRVLGFLKSYKDGDLLTIGHLTPHLNHWLNRRLIE